MGTIKGKEDVLNTVTLYNTIGLELEDILRVQEKSKVDFERYMGWEDKKLASIKKLSSADILKISEYFKIDGIEVYLREFQKGYKEIEKKTLSDYRENRKLFSKLKGAVRMLNNEYTEGLDVLEDISRFFDIEDERDIIRKADEAVALYKTANFNPDGLNLFAWMRRGELDFLKLGIRRYDRNAFINWIEASEWKAHLTETNYFKSLPELFKSFGAGLVLTPYLEKTVYGAVRWFDGVPLIQLSDREKSLAVCWYTLFHEIGHVLLHENDTIFEGEIDVPKSIASQKETEANAYAYGKLFNGDELRKYVFGKRGESVHDTFISDTASFFNVPVIFVAYWSLKAQIGNRMGKKYIPDIAFDTVT